MSLRLRIFSIFLSVMICLGTILGCSITVYASQGVYPSDKTTLEKIIEEGTTFIGYLGCRLKSLYDGNFGQWVQNKDDFIQWWNTGHISTSDDVDGNGTPGVVFDADLTAYMKQALIEYAEEVNGFRLYPTIDYNLVPASKFSTNYDYKTFRNIISESGCVVFNTEYFTGRSTSLFFGRPFHDISKTEPISLVARTNYSDWLIVQGAFYTTYSWTWYKTPVKYFATKYTDSDGYSAFHTFESWDEGKDIDQTATNMSWGLLDMRGAFPTGSITGNTFFSVDGRKLRVYNSLNALKNYVVGQRGVYFGSGFYDTPGEIKVTFEDLEKGANTDYDKLLEELKDMIGQKTDNEDSLTEEDLEKLVDKLLEGINNSGGGGGGDNDNPGGGDDDNKGDSDNSGILSSISSALENLSSAVSGYLDSILLYLESILTDLDYIVMELQEMTEEEAKIKSDSVISELKGTFSEVGDVMTKKFPFCIPWDLKQLYVTLNGGKEYVPEEEAAALSDGMEFLPSPASGSSPPVATSGKLVDVIVYSSPASRASPESGIMMLTDEPWDGDSGGSSGDGDFPVDAGVYTSESGAPVFHIPFVLKSVGINSALVIDMSSFDGVSDISRTLFLLIFLYQLILLSIRITEFLEGFIG